MFVSVEQLVSQGWVSAFAAEFLNGWKPCCLKTAKAKKSSSSGGNWSQRVHIQPGRKRTTHSAAPIPPTHYLKLAEQQYLPLTYPHSSLVPGSLALLTASCPPLLAWLWWHSGTLLLIWWSLPLMRGGHWPSAPLLPPSPPSQHTLPTSLFERHRSSVSFFNHFRTDHQYSNVNNRLLTPSQSAGPLLCWDCLLCI